MRHLTTKSRGRPIFWNGHLCEGDRMVDSDRGTFILWTRCRKHDVPANGAWEQRPDDVVTCAECQRVDKAPAEAEDGKEG